MIENIKNLRKVLGLSQADFANKIGVTQGHLSDIENSKKVLTDRSIKIICSEFNVNEEWLKTGEGEMFNLSSHQKEFDEVFRNLMPDTQQYLLLIARELLNTQQKLLNSSANIVKQ